MEPRKEVIGNAMLYLCDCMEIMPELGYTYYRMDNLNLNTALDWARTVKEKK